MNIKSNNLEILIKKGIPQEFENQIFEIEKNTFGSIYIRCPRTISAFRDRYKGKNLLLVVCIDKKKVIGFRLFEIINEQQVQSKFMVVKQGYRGRKLSNLICNISYDYFKWCGVKYIGSWTHEDITASKILAKYAPYISTSQKLNKVELEVLHNFERATGKVEGFYGNKRRVQNFYTMLDGRKGHANFWVHRL